MRKNSKILLLAVTIGILIASCNVGDIKESGIHQMKNDLYYLADDQMQGRETGSKGEEWAAQYIINRFRQLNLQPKGDNGSYLQVFDFNKKKSDEDSTPEVQKFSARNVIGFIDNKAENTVIIGAHYDHLGYGDENSLYKEGKAIHNGADDNASGTTAMIMLAERLKKRNKSCNYLFIAFSGEEKGLYGSSHFVKNPTIDLSKVNYMINLDMVGRMRDSSLVIYGTGTSPAWNETLDKIQMKDLKFKKSESGIGPSDQTSFYLQDIPVLHFFTGQHADYHKPSDDADKINYEGMFEVVSFIDSVITRLDHQGKLIFTRTKNEDAQKSRKFSVTLGVVPDYIYDGKGMRIDGISPEKTAEKAGLKKGDIVVKMGTISVSDMMSYMEALGKFKKGDTTTVTVIRNGQKADFKVQF
jgi:Zn-dependent M28 family amino/carboxypeptidase